MRGSTGGSQWAPLPVCLTPTAVWTRHHNVRSWHLRSSAEDIWSGPLCLLVEHLILLYLNRTEPITVTRLQMCVKCRLGGSSNSVSKSSKNSLRRTRCCLRGSMHKEAWGKAGLSTHLSQQMWPHPLRCPSPPPGLHHQCLHTPQTRTQTGCFQGKKGRRRLWQWPSRVLL